MVNDDSIKELFIFTSSLSSSGSSTLLLAIGMVDRNPQSALEKDGRLAPTVWASNCVMGADLPRRTARTIDWKSQAFGEDPTRI